MTRIRNLRIVGQIENSGRPGMDLDRAFEWLIGLKDCLEKNNVRWSLLFGTLLGAVREGDFIPWDSDIDTGAVKEDLDKEEGILSCLKSKGFHPFVCVVPPNKPDCRFIQMNMRGVQGHMTWKLRLGHIEKYWRSIMAYKPKTATIRGIEFPIPDHVDDFLHYLYGDWRIVRKLSDPLSKIGAWNPKIPEKYHA